MLQYFDPLATLAVAAPCFIRKVDTMSDCGRDEQVADHRVPEILQKVLRLDQDGCLSIYRVESALCLARLALAINEALGRYLTQDLIVVAFTEEELRGIACTQSDGESKCTFAKKRHYDLKPTAQQRVDLAKLLAQRQRMPKKLHDSRLKKAKAELTTHGCRSIILASNACKCD